MFSLSMIHAFLAITHLNDLERLRSSQIEGYALSSTRVQNIPISIEIQLGYLGILFEAIAGSFALSNLTKLKDFPGIDQFHDSPHCHSFKFSKRAYSIIHYFGIALVSVRVGANHESQVKIASCTRDHYGLNEGYD
jgi:hypothetical protein